MTKIVHIITGLGTGGAEATLVKLLSSMDPGEFPATVISLTDLGPQAARIQDLGVPVVALGMKPGMPSPAKYFELVSVISDASPDLVQTWMYHSDLIGGLAARRANERDVPVVWGVRNTNLDLGSIKRSTRLTARLCAKLSGRVPSRIVFCSQASLEAHTAFGYSKDKAILIPNGFDVDRFRPDPEARSALRNELGLSEDSLLIGLVGRYDPQKDHRNFARAAAILLGDPLTAAAHFVLCGDGITWENQELSSYIIDALNEAGVGAAGGSTDRFHLLGRRNDIPRIDAALDFAVLSSLGESFPNVVGEAMACGVPCAVTDVGDAAAIVADTGRVAPPKNPRALADAILELVALGADGRRALGEQARRRIHEHYSLPAVARRYEDLYRGLQAEKGAYVRN